MKRSNQKRTLGLSLVTAMLLTTGAYSAQIVGADPAVDTVEANTQYGFGGLNLENVNVSMVTGVGNDLIVSTFDPEFGTYPLMAQGDSFESNIFSIGDDKTDPTTRLGYVHQKVWPLSEPTGLKVINNDTGVSSGKPENCIMGSSYLNDVSTNLDSDTPTPVLCSSDAGSNKRFSLALLPNMVADVNPGEDGKYIDLVFNIDSSLGDHRYQVFQKVNNFTGMRLDGLKVQVLNPDGSENTGLRFSLGEGEAEDNKGVPTGGDLFLPYEMAFYPPGLWGDGSKDHLPTGWFDDKPSGYLVDGHKTNTLTTGARLDGNYVELFGNWQPEKWVALGMHEVIDVNEEPVLLAYWGTLPSEVNDPTAEPAWHYGMYDNDSVKTDFATPSQDVLVAWAADLKTSDNPDGKYVIDDIEDLPNLSLNYIVEVDASVTDTFIIRFTPTVSVDQTAPNYIEDDNVTYILPPTSYVSSEGIVTISPEPTFTPGTLLYVGVADADLNTDAALKETVDITVTSDTGDSENITLTETDVDSGVFSASLATENSTSAPVPNDGVMTTIVSAVVTATYLDTNYGTMGTAETLTESTTAALAIDDDADDAVDSEGNPASSGGGGCSYNPNSKSFDMMFLFITALGLLFPFRRRFLK